MSALGSKRVGVVLFNLGGPETLDDVRPFLYNLFSDPDIIRLPWKWLQKPLAWFISTQRYRKSTGYYRQIGGGSPLRKITGEQASALEAELARRGLDARVYIAMRYWNPFTEEAVDKLRRDGIREVVALPLYPQYSVSTTASSFNRFKELIGDDGLQVSYIDQWYENPGYIRSLSQMISDELSKFPDADPAKTHIVFSAHSVPVSYIEAGDPYLDQTRRTVELLMEQLGSTRPHSLSFQSKVGPVKWLQPSTDETIRKLAREGVEQALLVPVSFVSEHIETLYELDILYRDLAREVGLMEYRRVPALNCRPDFIGALAELVQQALAQSRSSQLAR